MGSVGHFSETERTVAISISSSGDNTVIAAPGAGKRIYIDHINLIPTGTVTAVLWNGPSVSGTAMSGAYPLAVGGGLAFDNAPNLEHGILECGDNLPFVIKLGGAVSCVGFARYRINNE